MGFGFCIPDNPYDRVAVRLGNVRPETHLILRESIPSHWQSETWDDEESVFYIGLKSQDALDQLNRHGVQRLICLRGIPSELTKSVYAIMLQHSQNSMLANEVSNEKQVWVATVEVLLYQIESALLGITRWDGELPELPPTIGAKAAMIYRTGQVNILKELASGLKGVLCSLHVGDFSLEEVDSGTEETGTESSGEPSKECP